MPTFAEAGAAHGGFLPGRPGFGQFQRASQKSHGLSYVKDEPHAEAYFGVGGRTRYP